MKKIFMLLAAAFNITIVFSQQVFKATIQDSVTHRALTGSTAFIKGIKNGAVADSAGKIELQNIPQGKQTIIFSFIGYETRQIVYQFPLTDSSSAIIIRLKPQETEMNDVVVSTRSNRSSDNTPTRIETISGEELGEKVNMKPGDIRMMLSESTGIQTQQTSATSSSSSIRIQGLDGIYTQILKDGFPLNSGFSGGLSLLQIPPLDLKQVEVIKGASSTLYGGGAIAGLVNLISKTPGDERELNFILNGTSALGLDASGFYAQKFNKIGTTVFAAYNHGTAYDPSHIDLSAIPKFDRYTFNPKLFIYFNEKTTLNIGFNMMTENRLGGDMDYIKGDGDSLHAYFEKNITNRYGGQAELTSKINQRSQFQIKSSISSYDRSVRIPDNFFGGKQLSSFSEANYHYKAEKSDWVMGINFLSDKFTQSRLDTAQSVNYSYSTIGAFIQNTWNASQWFVLETGFRADYQNKYGFFPLPKISALFKINPKLTARIGGGLGYRAPTIFTEDAERVQFKNVLPIDIPTTKAEQSLGGSFDVNYKTPLSDELYLSGNVLFFYTKVNHPMVFVSDSTGYYEFKQPAGYLDTKGIETNIKLTYKNFKFFWGYTLSDVNQYYNGTKTAYPLVAKNRLNNVLMYEIEDKLKIGLEAYYYSPQKLNDGTTGKPYWLCGLMAEKIWKRLSVFVNFENIFNVRQTKFGSIYTGTVTNPVFKDIYAPLDGFVANGGIKISL